MLAYYLFSMYGTFIDFKTLSDLYLLNLFFNQLTAPHSWFLAW